MAQSREAQYESPHCARAWVPRLEWHRSDGNAFRPEAHCGCAKQSCSRQAKARQGRRVAYRGISLSRRTVQMRSATVTFLIVLMALTFPMVVASPVHAAGDRPTVTPGDSGKQINTVVEASGERGTHAHSGRPAPDGSMGGVGQVAGEPIVLTDPQCVATDPAGSWCARSPEDGTAGATPTPFELAIKAT